MKQICISSDVQTIHLTLNYNDLSNIVGLELNKLIEDVPLLQVRDVKLVLLERELETIVDKLLENRDGRIIVNTKVIFKEKIIELDFRDSNDFYVCTLINLFDIVKSCNQLSGTLFVYNKELIEKYMSDSIISFLKVKHGLTREELKDGLNMMWQNSRGSNKKSIDYEVLDAGLNHLQKYGFAYYDKNTNKYNVTARGYMFY